VNRLVFCIMIPVLFNLVQHDPIINCEAKSLSYFKSHSHLIHVSQS
jgi:hypothetical protein